MKKILLFAVSLLAALAVCGIAKSQSVISPLDKLESFFYDGDNYPLESFFLMPEYDSDKKLIGFKLEDAMRIRYTRNTDGKLTGKTISYIDSANNLEDSYQFVYVENGGGRSVILFNCSYSNKTVLYRGLRYRDAESDKISLVLSPDGGYYSNFINADIIDNNSYDAAGRVIRTFRKSVTDGQAEYCINEYGYDEKGRLETVETYVTDGLGIDKLRLSYSSKTSYTENGIRIEHKFERPSGLSYSYGRATVHDAGSEEVYCIEEDNHGQHTLVMEVKTDKDRRISEQRITFDGEQILRNLYSYDKQGRTSGTLSYSISEDLLERVSYLSLFFSPMKIDSEVSYHKNIKSTKYVISRNNYWSDSNYLLNITTKYDKNNRPEQITFVSEFDDLRETYVTDKQYSKDGLKVTSVTKYNSPYYETETENSSTTYTYDKSGRVISAVKDDYRTDYEYNDNGELFATVSYTTDYYSEELVPYTRNEINAYDDYGMTRDESSYMWDSELNRWELNTRSSYTYHPLSLEVQSSETSYWNEYEQEFYYTLKKESIFEDSGRIKNEEVYYHMHEDSDNEWIPDTRTVYTRNPDSEYHYTNYIQYTWDTDGSEWIPESKYMEGDYFEWNRDKNTWEIDTYDSILSLYDENPYQYKNRDGKKPQSINYKLK